MGGPVRVLCVDDNRDVADSTALLLRLFGCDVRVSYDGPTALAEAEHFLPHVCFIDLNMPGMDGNEVAARLRQGMAGRTLLLVCATAMSGDSVILRTRQAGFDMHLVKPVSPTQIMAVVSKMAQS